MNLMLLSVTSMFMMAADGHSLGQISGRYAVIEHRKYSSNPRSEVTDCAFVTQWTLLPTMKTITVNSNSTYNVWLRLSGIYNVKSWWYNNVSVYIAVESSCLAIFKRLGTLMSRIRQCVGGKDPYNNCSFLMLLSVNMVKAKFAITLRKPLNI